MKRTDMTVTIQREDENGETMTKICRVWKDGRRQLWVRIGGEFRSITEVTRMFGEVRINA